MSHAPPSSNEPSPASRPAITAAINNYNYGRFLPDAIESVLAQTIPRGDLEILIVDDGSTDDSAERVRPYLDRVHWITGPHGGQATALNRTIAEARGEFIALLDADDLWEPNKLERVLATFRADRDVVMVQHWMRTVDASNRELPTRFEPLPARYTLDDLVAGRTNFVGTSGLTFRRDAVRALPPIPEALQTCADEYLYTHILFQGPVASLCEPLGRRRIHGTNLYAGTFDDPARLARHLAVRDVLDPLLERELSARGLALSKDALRQQRAERARLQLLAARQTGDWGHALAAWRDAVRHSGSAQGAMFKGATLLMALASPRAYSRMHRWYASRGTR
jgi:hypothetical protein